MFTYKQKYVIIFIVERGIKMAVDFRMITKEELEELEEERKQYIPQMFVETIDHNEILTELRFIFGYMHIGYFLLNGEDNVKLELHITKIEGEFETKEIHLSYIGVERNSRRKGIAHKHLQILTTLADRYEYTMDLEIDEKFGMDKEVLRKFYASHGFITDEYREDKMYRLVKRSE
jgi:GNAT superfamily N-acetyltransferase